MKKLKMLAVVLMTTIITGCTYEEKPDDTTSELLLDKVYYDLVNKLNQGEELTKEYVKEELKEFEVINSKSTSGKWSGYEYTVGSNNEELQILYQEDVSDYMNLNYSIKDDDSTKIITHNYNKNDKDSSDNLTFSMDSSKVENQSEILENLSYSDSDFYKVYEELCSKMNSNKEVSIEDVKSMIGKDYDSDKYEYNELESNSSYTYFVSMDELKEDQLDQYTLPGENENIYISYLKDTDKIYSVTYRGDSKEVLSVTNDSLVDENKGLNISVKLTLEDVEGQKELMN